MLPARTSWVGLTQVREVITEVEFSGAAEKAGAVHCWEAVFQMQRAGQGREPAEEKDPPTQTAAEDGCAATVLTDQALEPPVSSGGWIDARDAVARS